MTRSSFRALRADGELENSRTPALRAGAAGLVGLLFAGCIVRAGDPHPLYPSPETRRPPAEVARLFGPIAAVDGEDVSRQGKSFALLPGCHIVRMADKVGAINTTASSGFVGSTGGVIFALRMKANFAYEIEIQMRETAGPTGQLMIQAWERAADGSSATPIAPARSEADVADCQKWTP
jgi:hypothetical protein